MQIAAIPPTAPAAAATTSAQASAPPPAAADASDASSPTHAVSVTLSSDAAAAMAGQTADPPPAPAAYPSHVQIPQAVLDNMKAFQTTSPTAYTDQVNQLTSTINDAKAADGDRFDSFMTLRSLLFTGTIYKAGNLADFQTALDATQTSTYAKDLQALNNRFDVAQQHAASASRAAGQYGPQPVLDSLNTLSSDDQQKIFRLNGLDEHYNSLSDFKADYQNVADTYAATGQLTKGTRYQDETASWKASILGQAQSGALAGSDVALTLLQNAAAHTAQSAAAQGKAKPDAKSEGGQGPPAVNAGYQPGSVLSVAA